MDFEEFSAATLSVHQLEILDRWEQHARCAYEIFEKEGNRAIMIEELASVRVSDNSTRLNLSHCATLLNPLLLVHCLLFSPVLACCLSTKF